MGWIISGWRKTMGEWVRTRSPVYIIFLFLSKSLHAFGQLSQCTMCVWVSVWACLCVNVFAWMLCSRMWMARGMLWTRNARDALRCKEEETNHINNLSHRGYGQVCLGILSVLVGSLFSVKVGIESEWLKLKFTWRVTRPQTLSSWPTQGTLAFGRREKFFRSKSLGQRVTFISWVWRKKVTGGKWK